MGEGCSRILDELWERAVKAGASDVHFDPDPEGWSIRFRVSGELCPAARWDLRTGMEAAQRIKLLARMDIAEKRVPQDGGLRLAVGGREVAMRVATLPTVRGERLVVRIHSPWAAGAGLESGPEGRAEDPVWDRWLRCLEAPHGLFLVAGPTGSGKTTSLYRVVAEWVRRGECVVTFEDPVEREISGAHQVELRPARGFDYRRALAAGLRQDPSALAIGEIRDADAAWAAVHGALSGCRVVATIHARGPGDVWQRLYRWGVTPGELSGSLAAVLTQRLRPKGCPLCRRRRRGNAAGGVATPRQPERCPRCAGRGRAGFEVLYHLTVLQGRGDGREEEGRRRPSSRFQGVIEDPDGGGEVCEMVEEG